MRKLSAALLTLVALVGVYPASYSICPMWDVEVVDKSGKPLPGMTVRRFCNDYSAGVHSEEDRTTDQRGKVSFPAKSVRMARLIRWARNVINFVTQGAHASYGCHSSVIAFGKGWEGVAVRNGYVEDWRGSPDRMESRIIAAPMLGPGK